MAILVCCIFVISHKKKDCLRRTFVAEILSVARNDEASVERRGMIYIIWLGIKIHYNGRITHTYALGGVVCNLIFHTLRGLFVL